MLRPTNVEIDLNRLNHNVQRIKSILNPKTKYLAIVKADAYGHGIETVALFAEKHGADYLGVAIPEEGVQLRVAGVKCPILILGTTPDTHLKTVVEHDLIPAVFSVHTLTELQKAAAAQNKTCRFHFKIDTGMNRIGFTEKDSFIEAVDQLKDCPNLILDGMFTHFAVSEAEDRSFTLLQAAKFDEFCEIIHARGYHPLLHASNSGGILFFPELQYDMVRGGIAMYGYNPTGVPDDAFPLEPVMRWTSRIVHLKTVQPGESVSYGRRFIAERPTVIATVPVGYGDGYKRCLSCRSSVLIHGKRAPVVGSICMDQMMVDVTGIDSPSIDDEVVLLGSQGDESITADELASLAETVSYEILLSVSSRVPRVYLY